MGVGAHAVPGLHWQEHDGLSNAAAFDCPITTLWGADVVHEQLLGLTCTLTSQVFVILRR